MPIKSRTKEDDFCPLLEGDWATIFQAARRDPAFAYALEEAEVNSPGTIERWLKE